MDITISFYPQFDDQTTLDDHYFRALWFLSPYKDRINEIVFPCRPGLCHPKTPPAWLDPMLAGMADGLPISIQAEASKTYADQRAASADGVLLWSQDHAQAKCLKNKQVIRIDHQNVRNAASFYLMIHERFAEFQTDRLARSQEVFERIRRKCTSGVGYVFGTGPGLSLSLENGFDFSDGVCIACNSMVRNHELMTRINPPVITVADPIFHAGPSSYAAEFRKELIYALDRFDADLIVPMRDYDIYLHHMPERFANRIAALPFIKNEVPNLDLTEAFHVTTTGNILTLFLLPLAATFFREIRILGCDGRPMEANGYFWGHDKASQFNDQMDDIQRAHPAFFAIDYDDYYLTHCKTLETWLEAMENKGKTITNCTPSYIPALNKRTINESISHNTIKTHPNSNKIIVSIDPEVGSSNGHYLPLNIRSRDAAREIGVVDYFIAGNKNTEKIPANADINASFILPLFDCNTWSFRKRDIGEPAPSYEKFRSALQVLHDYLMKNYSEKEIHIVMYCGSMSAAEALYESFGKCNKIKISVHLMWCCFVDYTEEPFKEKWKDFVHEFLSDAKHGLFGSTQSIASGLSEVFSSDIKAIPHVTPTFSDSDIVQLLQALDVGKAANRRKILSFPALPNAQKGPALRDQLLWAIVADPELRKCVIHVRGEVPNGLSELLELNIWQVELDDEKYRELVSCADVAVQLYLPETFANRSSGLLLDLITNGVPVVSSPGSWVAEMVAKYDCGCVSQSFEIHDILAAIKSVLNDDEKYRKNARLAALDWSKENNWNNFVKEYCLMLEQNKNSSSFSTSDSVIQVPISSFVVEKERNAHAHVDETAVIARMLAERTGRSHVMIDVGAHFGTSASYYDKLGWTIHCFEPDPANREKLLARHEKKQNISIDIRAVSDKPAKGMSFFTSGESSGISALHAFRDTHAETNKVDVTTVAEIAAQHGLTHIDFLKIDVEGFDFNVIKGVPWDRLKPNVIECEYEDAKTLRMGHNWRDVCDFLCDKGYAVYISEWHPIIRYGIAHDWRRIVPYPQMSVPSESWGNILAFQKDPGYEAVQAAFQELVETHKPAPAAPAPTPVVAPARALSTLKDFHNKHQGKRCFIIGNGPSLNKHDLSLLEGEITFAVNAFFLKTDETGFCPTFLTIEDNKVMEENIERIKTYDVPHKFFPSIYKHLHPQGENVHFFEMDRGFYDRSSSNHGIPRFSTDASKVLYCGQSVTHINLQLAFYMGFSEVYLIGMDFDYVIPKEHVRRGDLIVSTTDDPNHFHKDYFGKGKTWKDPKLDRVAMNYRQAKLSYEAAGRKIYNATIGGKLEIFERVDYESLLRDPAVGKKRREAVAPVIATASVSAKPAARPVAASVAQSPVSVPSSSLAREPSRAARKWAKLKRDPHAFFRDAHFAPMRPLKHFFSSGNKTIWQVEREAEQLRKMGGRFSFLPASRASVAARQAAVEGQLAQELSRLRREMGELRQGAQKERAAFDTRENGLRNEIATLKSDLGSTNAALKSEIAKVLKAREDGELAIRADMDAHSLSIEERFGAEGAERFEALESCFQRELSGARKAVYCAQDALASTQAEMETLKEELGRQSIITREAQEALAASFKSGLADMDEKSRAVGDAFKSALASTRTEIELLTSKLTDIQDQADMSMSSLKEDGETITTRLTSVERRSVSLDLVSALRAVSVLWTGGSALDPAMLSLQTEHGHALLMAALVEVEKDRPGTLAGKTLIEIGSTRERVLNQGSTEKLALFTALMGMRFNTVDMDPQNTERAKEILRHLNPAGQAITAKGEEFLLLHSGSIDFVYLDAFDFDHGKHSAERQQRYQEVLDTNINDEACWRMHEACAQAVMHRMPTGGIVVLDDTWTDADGRYAGKGKLALPILLDGGFEVIAKTRTTVALRRAAQVAQIESVREENVHIVNAKRQ